MTISFQFIRCIYACNTGITNAPSGVEWSAYVCVLWHELTWPLQLAEFVKAMSSFHLCLCNDVPVFVSFTLSVFYCAAMPSPCHPCQCIWKIDKKWVTFKLFMILISKLLWGQHYCITSMHAMETKRVYNTIFIP